MNRFSKVIIWGHKLDTHTHSYIHYGFYRAFRYLGYETYWLDDKDDISNMAFDDCLFLSERQVESGLPYSKSSKYIFHSIAQSNKPYIYEPDLIIDILQTKCILSSYQKINDFTYSDNKVLIQPWATDLLPYEFDYEAAILPREPKAYFVGSVVCAGWNDNNSEIREFENECSLRGIEFDFRGLYTKGPISADQCILLMRKGIAAPTIQSKSQIDAGYIPCRIFKNISYGHYAMTNSEAIYSLFKVYMPNMIYDTPKNMLDRLFELKNKDTENKILIEQMKYIQNNHTYINRINSIFDHI